MEEFLAAIEGRGHIERGRECVTVTKMRCVPPAWSQCALQHIITGTDLYTQEQASIPLGGIQVNS